MRNQALKVICIGSLVCLAATVAAAPNLLPNSSFEEGATGWTLWHAKPGVSSGGVVVEQGARAGSRCFRVVNPGEAGANLHSDPIAVVPEADYTLSVYARTKGAKGVSIALWALDAEGKTIAHGLPHGAQLPGEQPAWARFKCIVRTPPNCVALKAHLLCGGGTVWWDAVMIEAGRDASQYRDGPRVGDAQTSRNLLSNSGFEDGDADWRLWHQLPGVSSGGAVEKSGRDGGRAFHVVNPGNGGANLYSASFACTPKATYTISVYARTKGGAVIRLAAWAVDPKGAVNHYAVEGAVAIPADVAQFTRYTKTFTTPADAAFLKAHLMCNGGEVWWDDCQIEAGDQATAYVAGPRVGLLPRGTGPQAVAYTRAIIREARLRDAAAQLRRLVDYQGAPKTREAKLRLDAALHGADEMTAALGAAYLVPDYRTIDYAALDKLAARAEASLSAVWRELGHDPQRLFEPWRPKLPADVDKKTLANEFLIFPCFTRSYLFDGTLGWDVLAPFGFRIVSGWWGLGYTREERLRSHEMDHVLRVCQSHGYRCDATIDPARAAVEALGANLGEAIYLHNAKGEWSPRGNCHNTVNIWHPEVRRVAAGFLRQLGAHYAKEAAIVSYELTNEPSLTIEKHDHGYRYTPIGVGGYSAPARQAFREWLRKRHQDIEVVNALWNREYDGFEQVAPPADLVPPSPKDGKTPVDVGAILDFQVFRAASHADWFRHCLAAFRAGDPRRPVCSQFIAAPFGRKAAAVDLRRMAEDVPWDLLGTHDWPGDRPAVRPLYVASANRLANRPLWEDEFIWSQWERKGTPEPVMRAALERNLWRQVAWGKRAISLFNYESEWAHDAPHNWNNSMLNIEADLEIPRYSTGVIPTVERKASGFKDILYRTRIPARQVAILQPTSATLVAAPDGAVNREGEFVAARLLEWHHLPLIIPEEHVAARPDDLNAWKLLIAPWAIHVPEAVQARLVAWIERGGILLATGPVGVFDEYGKPSGKLLRTVVGDLPWVYDAGAKAWRLASADKLPKVRQRAVAGGGPPLLLGAHGKGRLILWPGRLGDAGAAGLLRSLVDEVLPAPFIDTELAGVEIVPRETEGGEQFLFVTNLDAREAKSGTVLVRGKYSRVIDLSCEARPHVPVTHLAGYTRVPVRLHPGGAVFLALGEPEAGGRVGDGAAATELLKRYLTATTKASTEVMASRGPGPGQGVRRGLIVDRLMAVEIGQGPRQAAAYARRAKAIALLEPPKPVVEIGRVAKAPAIDGDLADWPAEGWVSIPASRTVIGKAPEPADLAASFQLAWDAEALYVACRVTDDKVAARGGAEELWRGDCAEVFLDLLLDHSATGAAYGPDDYQFFLTPGGGRALSHPLPQQPKYRAAGKAVKGGWVVEMALPWKQVGIAKPAAGYTFGFDLGVDDADASADQRECQLLWRGRADNHKNTTRFAPIRLR